MSDIVVTEFMDEHALEPLRLRYTVHYAPDLFRDPDEIVARAHAAQALIVRNQTQVTHALLARLPGLRVLGRLGVGLDNIDLQACAQRGLPVKAAHGTNEVSVAEHALAALLILAKPALHHTAGIAAGQWPRTPEGNHEVAGRTLGIVGLGRIGRRVAARAQAFDLRVLAYDPHVDEAAFHTAGVTPVSLQQLLAGSDFVSLHCPLNDETRGLIGTQQLAGIKPGARLINTARGHIVDETALVSALRSGLLGGAWLDVFAQEPVAVPNPFQGVPNLWLSAHTAGLTREAYVRASQYVATAVAQVLDDAAGR